MQIAMLAAMVQRIPFRLSFSNLLKNSFNCRWASGPYRFPIRSPNFRHSADSQSKAFLTSSIGTAVPSRLRISISKATIFRSRCRSSNSNFLLASSSFLSSASFFSVNFGPHFWTKEWNHWMTLKRLISEHLKLESQKPRSDHRSTLFDGLTAYSKACEGPHSSL